MNTMHGLLKLRIFCIIALGVISLGSIAILFYLMLAPAEEDHFKFDRLVIADYTGDVTNKSWLLEVENTCEATLTVFNEDLTVFGRYFSVAKPEEIDGVAEGFSTLVSAVNENEVIIGTAYADAPVRYLEVSSSRHVKFNLITRSDIRERETVLHRIVCDLWRKTHFMAARTAKAHNVDIVNSSKVLEECYLGKR